jgi:hypothetical protein
VNKKVYSPPPIYLSELCPHCNSDQYWHEDGYDFCVDCGYYINHDKTPTRFGNILQDHPNPYCCLRVKEKGNISIGWYSFDSAEELYKKLSNLILNLYDELEISRFDGKKIIKHSINQFFREKKLNRLQ